MKTNFLLPLVLLAATSCTSVKFAKAPDSLESGRAPANFQDDSLSNKSLTTIPEDCILADSRYISKNSTKHDLYYANPNKWSYAAENDTDIKPRIVVIKAACEAALQKNVTSISEKYFLTGTQLPFLPYAASSKRPYCGLSPSEDVCTAPTVAHPSYIFEVDQKSFPQDVENKVKSLSENIATGKKIDLWNLEDNITIVAVEFKRSPKSNFVMHFMDKATNVLTARGDVRFIILNKRESQPKADGPQGSQFQGDDWDVVYSYYTSKIDLTKSPDFSRFLKAHARSWDQDHRVEKWKIFYEGDYGN
ncbi:MAG TPA: hypothetical protein PLH57_04340, partial [Oligoflexia bacterium]|nr:hypothetical protein [Oligoflexia bacterium]